MELVKNIFFNTDKLVENSNVKISYTGDLFQNNAEEVYIHYVFGLNWEDLNEIKMGTLVTFWNIVLIIFLKKTHITKRIIVKIASKISHYRIKKRGNEIIVYDNFGDKVIAEVEIKRLKNGFKNNEITEELLKEKYDIELLEIKRKEEIITHITKETSIQEGDSIIIYGTMKSIKIALI